MLGPTLERFNYILANARTNDLNFRIKGSQDRWSWCDALFMAPPAWLRAYLATGDRRYLEFMDQEWKATSDYLYDKEEHLYFRDSTYFDRREANGRKVFGAGATVGDGGVARVLQVLPPEHRGGVLQQQYREMAAKIATLQQRTGCGGRACWIRSLPLKETRGRAFTPSRSRGASTGLAGPGRYEPWCASVAGAGGMRDEEGKLEHVQPIGADPKKFDPTHTDVYGVGAFLLAGSEIYRLASVRRGRRLRQLPAAAEG
jgi:hypothetical protein